MRQNIVNWFRNHPLYSAVIIVVVPALVGIIIGLEAQQGEELRKALFSASVALIFGGLIGGLLKILLDDFTLKRRLREDHATFVTNVLSDLKTVYDRVERVRILIPAHKSAKTYGDEMRDLINARVTLKNVIRALDRRKEDIGIREDTRTKVVDDVKKMEGYLEKLTKEFMTNYKNLSNHQRIYEEQVHDKLEKHAEQATVDNVFPEETVWNELKELKDLMGLIDDKETSPYKKEFEAPLDDASACLREELQRILSGNGRRSVKRNS